MKSPVLRNRRPLKSLLRDDAGLSTVEYIIILVLIAIVGMAAWKTFGEKVKEKIGGSTTRVNSLDPAAGGS